jgi:hypothetical protein
MSLRDLKTRRVELLQGLVDMGDSGLAEAQREDFVLRKFLPLPEYGRVLDPDCLLVIGDRGAGKTQVFRAIQDPEGRRAIELADPRLKADWLMRSEWLVGYSSRGQDFPWNEVWSTLTPRFNAADWRRVWATLLIRTLAQAPQSPLPPQPPEVQRIGQAPANDLEGLHGLFSEAVAPAGTWLDEVDRRLEKHERWLFVAYDELDRITGTSWEGYQLILQGLLQFWSVNSRRWRRLRPKIFLRRDLFEQAMLSGSDVSKLNAQRAELSWNTRNLYAMLAKRIFNQTDLFADYFADCQPRGSTHGAVGWMPSAPDAEDYRPMIEHLIGSYMGANYKKGVTFKWLPGHCMDANGLVLPRSFVRLIEFAAAEEQKKLRAAWPHLLHPTSLTLALDQVSEMRVQELGDEFGWMPAVQRRLKQARLEVPATRFELADALKLDWGKESIAPPETTATGLVGFLGRLGVFYEIPEGRINVRDLYLRGFGFKRKGGVSRRF